MSGHHHGPGGHAGAVHRWRLNLALVLVVTFTAVEIAAAWLSGSLALLADAGHMLADTVTLTVATIATAIAARTRRSTHSSYGAYRVEIFASAIAVLIMLATAVGVVVVAFAQGGDHSVETTPMLVVGVLGLLVNLVTLLILRPGAKDSLNVKGAYLEVMADALGSVGVIVAGVLVVWTGDAVWDIVLACAVGAFVVVRAIALGREVVHVLAQHTPHDVDAAALEAELAAIDGVREVHDLHVWTLTSGMNVMTVHLHVDEDADADTVLSRARAVAATTYRLEHATVQIERTMSHACEELAW